MNYSKYGVQFTIRGVYLIFNIVTGLNALSVQSAKRQAMFTFPMGYEGTNSTIIGYAPKRE